MYMISRTSGGNSRSFEDMLDECFGREVRGVSEACRLDDKVKESVSKFTNGTRKLNSVVTLQCW